MAKKADSQIQGLIPDSEITKLLVQLMAIPGKSGSEQQIAEFIKQQLTEAGAPSTRMKDDNAHRRSAVGGEVGNLILRLPGTFKAPARLMVAHMDTVPICVGARPAKRGKRIVSLDKHTGLGADNRAGVAVLLSTALSILRNELPHPPLTFLWTIEEEVGLHGARNVKLSALGKPKLAFNWDGGAANSVKLGATGGYRMEIEVRGLASHAGGHPERGISAIAIASLAIGDLVNNGWHGLIEKGRQTGTSNVGVFAGGEATNVVTDLVRLRAEARSHNPKFRERIVREIEKAFQRAVKQVRNVDGKKGEVIFDGHLDYDSFRLPMSDPSVQAAAMAVKLEHREPEFAVVNGGLDANWLSAHGIPTVTLGCGQNHIHTVDEWLALDEFHCARRIAMHLATTLE